MIAGVLKKLASIELMHSVLHFRSLDGEHLQLQRIIVTQMLLNHFFMAYMLYLKAISGSYLIFSNLAFAAKKVFSLKYVVQEVTNKIGNISQL